MAVSDVVESSQFTPKYLSKETENLISKFRGGEEKQKQNPKP